MDPLGQQWDAQGTPIQAPQQATSWDANGNPIPAAPAAQHMAAESPKGLIAPGNLDISNRPIIHNAEGTISSEYSASFQDEKGHEVLVPSIVNGRFLTPDGKKPQPGSPQEKAMFQSAWRHYQQTGEHLGIFDNAANADSYAQILHNRSQQPAAPSVTDNPAGEGIYRMIGPDGKQIGVPYSKAKALGKPQGYQFADPAEAQRFMKDYVADPQLNQDLIRIAGDNPGVNLYMGFAKHALRTALGLADIGQAGANRRKQNMQGFDSVSSQDMQPQPSKARDFANEPDQNVEQLAGGTGEDIAEFLTGEKLLTLLPELTGAQKLEAATKLAKMAEKHPLLANALKQGTVAGAQTQVRTGDPVQAGEAAIGTGLISGVAGAAGKLGESVRARVPGTDVVNGETFDTPAPRDLPKASKNQTAGQAAIRTAAQDTARGHLEEANQSRTEPAMRPDRTLPARTGPFEFNLKGLPPEEHTTGDMATRAAEIPRTHTSIPADRAGKTNYSRVGTEPEYIRPGDTVAQRTGRVHVERRIPGAMHSSAPGETPSDTTIGGGGTLTTQDPNVARAHVGNLNELIEGPHFEAFPPEQQQQLLEAREDAQRQLGDYHEQVRSQLPGYGKPQLPQIDIPKELGRIGSYSDTAAVVKKAATDGYDQITDALAFTGHSPQQLTMIRQSYQTAEQKFMAAETPQALHAAEGEIEAAHEQLRQMVSDRIPNAVTLKEFSGLNDSYRNALGLEKFARAVDGSFHGSMSNAQRAYEYAGFDGKQLQGNLDKIIQSMGRGRVDRLVGRDNVDSLLRVAQLNSTNAGRKNWGVVLRNVGQSLAQLPMHTHVGPIAAGGLLGKVTGIGWEAGAFAGWGTAEGMRRLNNLIVTNPQVAKNVLYALDYGARPEKYGPFIASMIQQLQLIAHPKEEQEQNADQAR